jgi:hypothetical protein
MTTLHFASWTTREMQSCWGAGRRAKCAFGILKCAFRELANSRNAKLFGSRPSREMRAWVSRMRIWVTQMRISRVARRANDAPTTLYLTRRCALHVYLNHLIEYSVSNNLKCKVVRESAVVFGKNEHVHSFVSVFEEFPWIWHNIPTNTTLRQGGIYREGGRPIL